MVKGFAVDQRVHRVDNLEVLGDEYVGLLLARKDANDFGKATLMGPVIAEGVLSRTVASATADGEDGSKRKVALSLS